MKIADSLMMVYEHQYLVGSWYRSDTDGNDNVHTELAQLFEDGCYEFNFSVQDKNGTTIDQSIEGGDWGLVGDIHFTIAKYESAGGERYIADATNPDNYHAYKIIELTGQLFKYQHIVSNEVFILKRVIDKIAHC